MNPEDRLTTKLHSSLISNELEKEVVGKLEWYRTALLEAKRENRLLKDQLAKVHSDNDWVRYPQMGAY